MQNSKDHVLITTKTFLSFFLFFQLPHWINMLKKKKKKNARKRLSFAAQSSQKMQPHGFQVKKKCYWTILNFERYA